MRSAVSCCWGAVAALLGGVACGSPAADAAPVWEKASAAVVDTERGADLAVWPADGEMWALVEATIPRIERATGLQVVATSDAGVGRPLFWATTMQAGGWQGLTHIDEDGTTDWLAVSPNTPPSVKEAVVLHEVLHGLGAMHVADGAGVMSPGIWVRPEGWQITEADLESVCAAAPCSAFVAEVTP